MLPEIRETNFGTNKTSIEMSRKIPRKKNTLERSANGADDLLKRFESIDNSYAKLQK